MIQIAENNEAVAVGGRSGEVVTDLSSDDRGAIVVIVFDDGNAVAIADDQMTAGRVPADVLRRVRINLTAEKADLFYGLIQFADDGWGGFCFGRGRGECRLPQGAVDD